jgi:uncharacterized protein involved in exopolysaccharide biosynthesis
MTRELTTSIGRQTISIRDGAAALFRRKWMVLLIFLTVLAGTVLVTIVLPDKYESRMKILVRNQRIDVAITPGAAEPSVGSEGEVTENQINSEIELLTSKDLLTQVVKECGLADQKSGWLSSTKTPSQIEYGLKKDTLSYFYLNKGQKGQSGCQESH